MIRKYLLLSWLLLAVTHFVNAQTKAKMAPDKQRATQWKPEKGQYYFSYALVFDYQNKADKTSGQVKVYLDPVTGAMCFRKESSFGNGGKNFDFLINFPDGRLTYCGVDEAGKKIKIQEQIKEMKPDAEMRKEQADNFGTYCVPTGNKRADFGFESLEYDLTYATSGIKDKIWLTKVPFSSYPIYGLEFAEGAVSLPFTLDFIHMFTPDQLVTEINSKDLVLKLTDVKKEPFLAVTRGYQLLKVND